MFANRKVTLEQNWAIFFGFWQHWLSDIMLSISNQIKNFRRTCNQTKKEIKYFCQSFHSTLSYRGIKWGGGVLIA